MASSHQLNPYVGPRCFESHDRNLFYGRDEEVNQLIAWLIAHQVVLLYAQSGAGKTSCLHAGVIPALEQQGQFLVLPVARVSDVVFPGLAVDQVTNIYVFNLLSNLGENADIVQDDLPSLARLGLCEGLKPYLTDRQASADDQGAESSASQSKAWNKPRLLILDQFEEIFTSNLERYADRDDFFRQLGECLSKHPELGLLISMREEYLAQLDSYAAHIPDRLRSRFRLERMDWRTALEAVKGPAQEAGLPFAPGVAETLVDDLRRTSQALTPDVELVSLQVTCYQLWNNLPQGSTSIEMADLKAFGNADAALSRFYENALARVVSDTGVSERQLRAWFDEQMITSAGTRGLVYRDKEETAGLPNQAVHYLESSYIIRAMQRAGATWYELTHDRLIEPIRNANRLWQIAARMR